MKKLLFTPLFILAFASLVSAQIRYTILPKTAVGFAPVEVDDASVDAKIHNLTSETLALHWERTIISLTPGCETAVCDAVLCYSRETESHNFNLLPNVLKPFLVHFYNNGAPCAGIVHVKVTNQNDPADSVNVVFLFNQSTAVQDLPAATVRLYPNPVTDFFSLEHAEHVAIIRVFTLDGREVSRFEAKQGELYSMQDQAAGNYVLALEDKNGRPFRH